MLQTWGEGYIPHSVILDPLGIVRGNWVGWSDAFGQQMHETIATWANPTGLYFHDMSLVADSDGDGVPEPGETIELDVLLENRSELAVGEVSVQLTSTSEWVSFSQDEIAWPDFTAGATEGGAAPFVFHLDAGAPAAMDLPFRLMISTDRGNAVQEFSLEVGRREPYWDLDCESATGDWSHAATAGWTDVWHLSTEDSHSPSHAWKAGSASTGTYGNHVDCRLVGPPLELQPWSRLTFQHRMDAEISSTFPDSAYDGGTVEISLDDGATWSQLLPLTGYNKAFRALSGGGNPASHNFPGQTPCYSGSFSWEEAVFDLADFNGLTVRLAFHFGSDNGGALEGWYIDDLVLAAPTEDTALTDPAPRPGSLALLEAWPNPFNPTARVAFELAEAGPVRLALFDLAGRRVAVLADGSHAVGRHELTLDGARLAGGLYLLRLETARGTNNLKVLLLR
ncbi:MAG: hypothetical protein Q8O14_05990 [bacterium]|nr:hypothetical protein [bacterium]